MSRSLIGSVRIALGLSSAEFERKMSDADKKTLEFKRSIKRAAYQVDRKGRELQKYGKALTRNVTTPLVAVATGLAAATVATASYANEIDKASIRSGIGAERLQELRFAAGQLGVEFSSIERSVDAFRRRMPQIIQGSGRAYDTFQQLGIQLNDTSGEVRQMDDLFDEMIRKLRGVSNANQQATMAQQLFGRGASEMIPILQATEDQFEGLIARSRELGLVMSQDAVSEMVEFYDQLDEIKQQGAALSRELGMVLLPVIRDELIPFLQDSAIPAMRDMAQWFASLDPASKKAVLGLGAFTAAVGPAVYISGTFLRNLSAISALLLTNPFALAATGLAIFTGYMVTAAIRAREMKRYVEEAAKAFDPTVFNPDGSLEELERRATILQNRMRDAGQTLSVNTLSAEQRKSLQEQLQHMAESLVNVQELIRLRKEESATIDDNSAALNRMQRNYDSVRVAAEKYRDVLLDDVFQDFDLDFGTFDLHAIEEASRMLNLLARDQAVSFQQIDDAVSALNTQINQTFNEELRAQMMAQRDELEEYRIIMQGLGIDFQQSFGAGIAGAQMFGAALANGMEAAVFQGERLQDILRNILRQLASQALRNLIMGGVAALFTGGTVGLSTLFTGAAVPMATGGIVPGGFPNDTYPALLSSGERVIPSPIPLGSSGMGGGGGGEYVPVAIQIDGREVGRALAKLQRRKDA